MGQSGRSNRASRKRSTFRDGRGDNAPFLAGSAYLGMLRAQERRGRLLSRIVAANVTD